MAIDGQTVLILLNLIATLGGGLVFLLRIENRLTTVETKVDMMGQRDK